MFWFHPDHLGSSNYITNFIGDVSQHMEYFAFGETFVEEHKNSHNSPYKFNGKELDEESGYTYFGARYLDMRYSIWTATDPLSGYNPIFEEEHYIDGQHNGGVHNAGNLNTYGYCYQNPARYIDPNGKQIEAGAAALSVLSTGGTLTGSTVEIPPAAVVIGVATLIVAGGVYIYYATKAPAVSVPKAIDIPQEKVKPKPKTETFYRAMSMKEYNKTLGLLVQRTDEKGNYKGEGPFVTPSLEYAQKALNDFKGAKKYDLIVEYTVQAGTKEFLDKISLPNLGVSGARSELLGLPIKKVENVGGKPVTNYSFYGMNTSIFNFRLVAPPIPIEKKK